MTANRRRIVLPVAIAVGCIAAVSVWGVMRQRDAQEKLAIGQLRGLGALVVLDGNRKHAASVNLSTVKRAEQLRQAVVALPSLHQLGALDASRTAISDEDLVVLGRVSSLSSLTLAQTDISDEGVHHLTGLGGLEALYLMETRVTSDGLDKVAALKGLRMLDLSQNQIAGDLSALTQLPQLEWLLLRGTTLDQQALASLSGAPTLRRLSLEGAEYDPSHLDPLRASRDALQIDE